MSRPRTILGPVEVELARALGYPDDATALPHLSYIIEDCTSRYAPDDYLRLAIHVIEYFKLNQHNGNGNAGSRTIQTLLEELERDGFRDVFTDTATNPEDRRKEVDDHVMCIIGRWTMLLNHFELRDKHRKISVAYNRHAKKAPITSGLPDSGKLAELIKDSKILQLHDLNVSTAQDSANNVDPERLSIISEDLNAFTLSVDAAVEILWTFDLSQHMCLTTKNGRKTLNVFALPCVFDATHYTPEVLGIPQKLVAEIRLSYAMLFNRCFATPFHAVLGWPIGLRKICWCRYCSAFRYQQKLIAGYKEWCEDRELVNKHEGMNSLSPEDKALLRFMKDKPLREWNASLFPHLWPRLVKLREYQLNARPWNIWMLLRDRRDTLQYWTFLFATVVLLMTLMQVILGIAQVVGTFR